MGILEKVEKNNLELLCIEKLKELSKINDINSNEFLKIFNEIIEIKIKITMLELDMVREINKLPCLIDFTDSFARKLVFKD